MPSTDTTIDPDLYQLFERIVREAPPATDYEIDCTGTRPDSSTFRYTSHFNGDQQDQIPWGTQDAIRRVTWYPAGMPKCTNRVSYMLPEHNHVEVRADVWDHGIVVITHEMGHIQHYTVGIKGTVRAMGIDKQLVALPSTDEVVAKVLELINEIHAGYEAEMRYESEYDYDDRSRYDPLDERNYPLHER